MRLIPKRLDEFAASARETAREQGESISRAVRTNTMVVALVGALALLALIIGVRAAVRS